VCVADCMREGLTIAQQVGAHVQRRVTKFFASGNLIQDASEGWASNTMYREYVQCFVDPRWFLSASESKML